MKKIKYATLFSIAAGLASGAQAQTALGNGATISVNTSTTILRTDSVNSLDLSVYGTQTTPDILGFSLVSRTPMIQTFSGTDVSLSFSGSSGVFNSTGFLPSVNPGDSRNYLMAANASVSLDFSSAQNYFTMRCGSVDLSNNLAFYNGDQLISSLTGADLRSLLGVSTPVTSTVEFNFAEVGFTSVVARGDGYFVGFDRVSFASNASVAAPEVAPLPRHDGPAPARAVVAGCDARSESASRDA